MKNKVLILSIATISIAMGSLVALSSTNNLNVFAIGDGNHNHTIMFTTGCITSHSVVPETYDYWTEFHVHKDNAIVVSENEKYDIDSVDYDVDFNYGTYAYGDASNFVFNGSDCLIEIKSAAYDSVTFVFSLKDRADVDLNESEAVVHNVTDNNYSLNTKFDVVDMGSDYFDYGVTVDTSSCYGDNIKIEYIKLVFTC